MLVYETETKCFGEEGSYARGIEEVETAVAEEVDGVERAELKAVGMG